jgi:hypothetical protein
MTIGATRSSVRDVAAIRHAERDLRQNERLAVALTLWGALIEFPRHRFARKALPGRGFCRLGKTERLKRLQLAHGPDVSSTVGIRFTP